MLFDIGVLAGLLPNQVAALLRGDDGLLEVVQYESLGDLGRHPECVPSVIAGNLLLFSGAQRSP